MEEKYVGSKPLSNNIGAFVIVRHRTIFKTILDS